MSIITKRCFKCGQILPLDDFYKHKEMKDGHLNKCKNCTKKDVHDRREIMMQDQAYIEKERARGREKFKRLRRPKTEYAKEKEKSFPGLRSARKRFPIKIPATIELHHWNYNFISDVIALDRRLHHIVHSQIRLDLSTGFYFFGNEPLDTIQKHLDVIRKVCDKRGFDYSNVKVIHL